MYAQNCYVAFWMVTRIVPSKLNRSRCVIMHAAKQPGWIMRRMCYLTLGVLAAGFFLRAHSAPPGHGAPPAVEVAAGCATKPLAGSHRTYDVGPGQRLSELTDVPWLSLEAGDVVNIFYRSEPYRTKIGLRAAGTAAAPVVINGVTDGSCNRPEISGRDSTTAADATRQKFFSEKYSEFLGTVFIYRSPSDPYSYKPRHITISNLRITGAAEGNYYRSQSGRRTAFAGGAAGIYAIVVEDLLVENCEVTGNGNGIFVNTRNDAEEDASRRIVIRRSKIHLNGHPGSYYEHNLYIQSVGAIYEGNYIGQLVAGAQGSSLKDRSSGTIIRYNRIDAAARAIDLVETDGGRTTVFTAPDYNTAWVYGNVIVSDWSSPLASSGLLIHWGCDQVPELCRKGTLYFYYNTVITRGSLKQEWRMNIFDLWSKEQRVEARGNVFQHIGDANHQLLYKSGVLDLVGTNWITRGWQKSREEADAVVNVRGKLLEGDDPGFENPDRLDWRPRADSPLTGTGDSNLPAPLADHDLDFEYVEPNSLKTRVRHGAAWDLGAFDAL